MPGPDDYWWGTDDIAEAVREQEEEGYDPYDSALYMSLGDFVESDMAVDLLHNNQVTFARTLQK